jgi:hypothetical protein
LKVALCCPTITRPYQAFLDAVEAEIPHLEAAGHEHGMTFEVGSAYISYARARLLRKAMTWDADVVVFLDHDMSWKPGELTRLVSYTDDVICGTYRFKQEPEEYMGTWRTDDAGVPKTREDGCIHANWVPAGFLKITSFVVHKLMGLHPELVFGPRYNPSFDLFNHGAHEGVWYGEDYAFSRRWNASGGEIWIVPDLEITHHGPDGTAYPGNFHEWLLRRPGGSKHEDTSA